MSLVREALAKAEREAAARAAREKGLPPALADAAQPYRAPRRRRGPWIAALAVATLTGAAAAYLLLGPRPESGGTASAEPAPGAERMNRERIPGKETAPRTEAPSRPQEPFPTGGRGTADSADSGAGSSAAQAAMGTLAGSYVREFALDGGRSIRLGGIAWSEAAPLAYLNGKLRGVGEIVEGWRVAAIERERVVLESGHLRVAVNLR